MNHNHSKIHFVGVGGSGMLGLAEWAIIEGLRVTGSDTRRTPATERLTALGATIEYNHSGSLVEQADLVVRSTAIRSDNPELLRAAAAGVRTISRGQFLGEMSRHRRTIAICGSHGKSTTTAMLAHALRGFWPAHVYLGAVARNFSSSFHSSNGARLIAEVDESDGTFLDFHNDISVLTGLSNDHESFYGSKAGLYNAFQKFMERSSLLTTPVACAGDPEVRDFIATRRMRCQTYGLTSDCEVYATEIKFNGPVSSFMVRSGSSGPSLEPVSVTLPCLGSHNVMNALAVFAIAVQLGVPWPLIAPTLTTFSGVERRMERIFSDSRMDVFSDYAHNPQKIAAALQTLCDSYGRQKVLCIFEPHRYTRLHSMWAGFIDALGKCAKILVLPLYSAGESPIEGYGRRELVAALNAHHQGNDAPGQCTQAADIEPTDTCFSGILDSVIRNRDSKAKTAIVFVGAGYSHDYACQFVAVLEARNEKTGETS